MESAKWWNPFFFWLPKDWCWHLWNLPSLVNGKMSLMLIHPWIWRLYNSASEEKNVSFFLGGGRQAEWMISVDLWSFFLGVGCIYIYMYKYIHTYIIHFCLETICRPFCGKKTLQKKGDLNLKDKTEAQNKTNFGGKSSTQVRICDEFPRSFSL